MAKTQAESNLQDPQEMFAWMFAAGVPDPRMGGGKFPNQPCIPPMCFPALSEMLYKMGARFHPELQEMWVTPNGLPFGNFQVAGTTDVKPEDLLQPVAEMVADQFPEIAERIKRIKPGDEGSALAEQSKTLLASIERLNELRKQAGR